MHPYDTFRVIFRFISILCQIFKLHKHFSEIVAKFCRRAQDPEIEFTPLKLSPNYLRGAHDSEILINQFRVCSALSTSSYPAKHGQRPGECACFGCHSQDRALLQLEPRSLDRYNRGRVYNHNPQNYSRHDKVRQPRQSLGRGHGLSSRGHHHPSPPAAGCM